MSVRLPGQIPRVPPAVDRWLRRGTFGLLTLLALALLTHKIFNSDIWWHLKTGERILAGSGIPQTDPYTYTVAGAEWIDLHWGFQVIVALLFRVAGPVGWNLYLYVTVGLALVITARNQYDPRYWSITALFLLLLLLAANPRFLARPEGISFVCLSAVMWILLRLRDPRWERWVWAVPAIVGVWANVQGLFILGIVLLLLVAAGDVVRRMLAVPFGWAQEHLLLPQARRLWSVAGLSIIAGLATPYGVRGLLFPFTLFTRVGGQGNVFSQVIAEFQPPFLSGTWAAPTETFLLFLVVALTILIANVRSSPVGSILIVTAFTFLALSARRNVPVALFVLTPLAVGGATDILKRAERVVLWDLVGVRSWAQAGLAVVVCLVAAWHLPYILSDRYYVDDRRGERFGLGVADNIYPGGAVDFVVRHELPGPLFNSMYIGGYVIYRLAPDRYRVSLDSRLEVHTQTTLGAYVAAARGVTELKGLLNLYDAETAVLTHNSQDAGNLITSFLQLPDWRLVYLDPCSAVFVKSAVARARRLDPVIVPLPPEVAARPVSASVEAQTPEWARALAAGVDRLHWGPRFPGELFHMATLYLQLGGAGAAIPLFEEGVAQYPATALGWYNLGKAYQDSRRYTEAQEAYEQAVEREPKLAAAWVNLGLLRAVRGERLGARRAYERAVQADAKNVPARYNLARTLVEDGQYDRAYYHFRRLTRDMPQSSRWWFEFGRTCRQVGRFREGVVALDRALELDADRIEYWLELSDLLYANEQRDRGTAALRAAFELDRDSQEVRRRMRDMGGAAAP